MSRHINSWLGSLIAFAIVIPTLCAAQETESNKDRLKEKLKKAFSSPVAPIKTMPPNAIMVLDPGVDPKGEPRAILRKHADESLDVDIPETVHVHKYFPSGSREFQAQYFAGGPTIVAAQHPYTHERVYVHLDLSPGFPKVKYEEDKIEYKYPEESFSIHFIKCGDVQTSYCGCRVVCKRTKDACKQVKEKVCDCTDQLGVNHLVTTVSKEVKDTGAGTVAAAGTFVHQSADLLITALDIVPGLQMLKSAAQDRASKERDRAVQRVTRERENIEKDFNSNR